VDAIAYKAWKNFTSHLGDAADSITTSPSFPASDGEKRLFCTAYLFLCFRVNVEDSDGKLQ